MGKIQGARERVLAIQSQIKELEQQVSSRSVELGQIQAQLAKDTGNPELIARSQACRETLSRLQAELPREVRPREARPRLQYELENAEAKLEELRQERQNLKTQISTLEKLEKQYAGELPGIIRALRRAVVGFQKAGYPQGTGLSSGQLLAFLVWADRMAADLADIDNWRQELESYGPDPELDKQLAAEKLAEQQRLWGGRVTKGVKE